MDRARLLDRDGRRIRHKRLRRQRQKRQMRAIGPIQRHDLVGPIRYDGIRALHRTVVRGTLRVPARILGPVLRVGATVAVAHTVVRAAGHELGPARTAAVELELRPRAVGAGDGEGLAVLPKADGGVVDGAVVGVLVEGLDGDGVVGAVLADVDGQFAANVTGAHGGVDEESAAGPDFGEVAFVADGEGDAEAVEFSVVGLRAFG